jgi:Uma2 family endonuclease
MNTVEEQKTKMSTTNQTNIWRIIMNNRITKFAVAAVVLAAVVLSITIFDNTVQEAYAIEQTIEANRGVRFIHLKFEPASAGHVEDIWAQFDDNQKLLHLRMHFPNPSDGTKVVVWQEGKGEIWSKAKKKIVVFREENMLARLKMPYKEFDPKLIVELLYQAQNDERYQIEIQEPRSQNEPIIITLVKDDSRKVFEVDSETKLLQQLEIYRLKDGDYTFLGRTSYLDYNQSDPEIFVLNPPSDVIRLDQTTGIGLAQGDLSDEEIVVEVATQFFQALIDEDYAKAGLLWGGVPPERIKTIFHVVKFVRIVSIGKVVPHSNPLTGGLSISCEIEMEHAETGERMTETINPGIRKVEGSPDRWSIFSGI